MQLMTGAVRTYDPGSGYRMITGRDQLSVDPHFTEQL